MNTGYQKREMMREEEEGGSVTPVTPNQTIKEEPATISTEEIFLLRLLFRLNDDFFSLCL